MRLEGWAAAQYLREPQPPIAAPPEGGETAVIFIGGIGSGTSYEEFREKVGWLENMITLDPRLREAGMGSEVFHFFDYNDYELNEGESYSNEATCQSIDDKDADGGDILGTSRSLEVLVSVLRRDNPALTKVAILGHSMGGVIAAYTAPSLLELGITDVVVVTFDSPLQGLNSVQSAALDVFGDGNCLWLRNIGGGPGFDSPLDMRNDSAVVSAIADRSRAPGIQLFTINADPGLLVGVVPDPFAIFPATVGWAEGTITIQAWTHTEIWSGILMDADQYELMRIFLTNALAQLVE